ncbi:MAG: hypothetical protein H0T83_06940 [Chthoniobacterales bacterium]|nr:hypothetical protein [Chthoniobacterales bacterium]
MTIVPPMRRSLFREAAVFTFAAALVCFCSCERHRADELPSHEENANSEAAAHEHADKQKEKPARSDERGDSQSRATTAMSVTPPPASPSLTPANFFPTATPH